MSIVKTNKGTELVISDIKGKPYLQVAQRIIWFREDHPTWSIETEIFRTSEKASLAKAWIKDETGRIIAVSHKLEDIDGFHDFIEKSETGAIGRALALCGYGTQFAQDLDEGERIVDSPQPARLHPQREPFPRAPIEKAANSYGLYTIKVGTKYKDKKINEVPIVDLKKFINYFKESSAKNNEPLTGDAKEFVDIGEAYLKSLLIR